MSSLHTSCTAAHQLGTCHRPKRENHGSTAENEEETTRPDTLATKQQLNTVKQAHSSLMQLDLRGRSGSQTRPDLLPHRQQPRASICFPSAADAIFLEAERRRKSRIQRRRLLSELLDGFTARHLASYRPSQCARAVLSRFCTRASVEL